MFTKRVALFTGKGGVGRSTMAAATALAASRKGLRVLLAEIGDDPGDYSPLARNFGRERLSIQPEQLTDNLKGVVLLARTGQELFLKTVVRSATLARAALSSDALRRLLSAGPSFKEMGVFFQLLTYLRAQRSDGSPEYQLILIDMPATGHTLSLTGLPQLLLRLLPRGPIAEALREGQKYLNDPALAAAYVVVIPETLPVSECFELLQGLEQTQMPCGGIFLNRLPVDPFTPTERAAMTPLIERGQVLGQEGFTKPLAARKERERLLNGTSRPVYGIDEFPQENLLNTVANAVVAAKPLVAQTKQVA